MAEDNDASHQAYDAYEERCPSSAGRRVVPDHEVKQWHCNAKCYYNRTNLPDLEFLYCSEAHGGPED